jgi:hypothetical protein
MLNNCLYEPYQELAKEVSWFSLIWKIALVELAGKG